MKPQRLFPQIFVVAIGLLLLGGLGAYWPTLVGAKSPEAPLAPAATVGDGITYQGYLTDENGVPLNGTITMRFVIFNDAVAGSTLWDSGDMNVTVNDGLFDTYLSIDTDIFNGEELWVSQIVDGETLTPRQEIAPVPMAHTLRPGAVVKGTANALPNNYMLEVHMNNDAFAFNRGAITGQSTTGNAIYGLADNGRAIYGQTRDGYAVYGFDGGSNANQGYAGYFYSTNGVGVYGYSNGNRAHPNIYAPGVYGQSNQGVGVYGRGDTSNSFTFYNQGGYFVGGKGLYALGTDSAGEAGYGAQIYGSNYRGMYVQSFSGHYDAYFGGTGGIFVNGAVVNSVANSTSLAVNLGETTIAAGDLVAMVGVAPSPNGDMMMLAVAKADVTNQSAVIGVAVEAYSTEAIIHDDGSQTIGFSSTSGAITPNSYLTIITEGLAPTVNVTSLALVTNGEIGDKVSLAPAVNGEMTLSLSENAGIIVGRMAGPIDEESGTVPMFIDID
ncbi:hypothetical protein [Candidatus Leptofilum sp.]|uniref:hypothetical protein n=1 Tax=Candidatus Leptofilum sp. TaxID=3241576 RepID=UPI003B5B7DFF